MFDEEYRSTSIGEFRDIIKYSDGTIVETPWSRNTIVDGLGKLVACLLKSHPGYGAIAYWAVGSGGPGWDDTNPPAPASTDLGCITEIGRKAILPSNISFVDVNGAITQTITNRILIDLTFDYGDCNGMWREFAIYGGNATTVLGSGIAINHKTHGLITKTGTVQVQRQIRFTFK